MEQKTFSKKKKATIILAVIILVVILLSIYLASGYPAKAGEEESLLRDYPVTRGDIMSGVDGSGALTTEEEGHNFSIPIQLGDILVNKGDVVKQGDKLAEVAEQWLQKKETEYGDELKKAQLALKNAKNEQGIAGIEMQNTQSGGSTSGDQGSNSAGQANIDGSKNRIEELNTQIGQKEEEISQLNQKIDALTQQIASLPDTDAQKAGLISEQNVLLVERETLTMQRDALQTEVQGQQGALDAATQEMQEMERARNAENEQMKKEQNKQKRINGLKTDSSKNAVALAEIEVEMVQRKIDELRTLIDDPFLYAQRDGVVGEINYVKGAETQEDKAVMSIGNPDSLSAVLQVTQADIVDIEPGQIVKLSFDAFPDRTFMGKVVKKVPIPVKDSNPVAYPVYVEIDTEGEELLNGMTCSAQFIIKQVDDILQISNKAIKVVDGKQVVIMKDENGDTYEQIISTGFSDGKYSEVLSGLKEGDVVYVEG